VARESRRMEHLQDILIASGVHKSFGKGRSRVHVLRGLDLRVKRGEFLAVMGPSGCGKSTLLHVIGLMTSADDGKLVLDGRAVGKSESERTRLRRTHIGFVFQRFNLISVLSARDNAVISMRVRGLDADGCIDDLLASMGISHVAGRKPGEMSIGEQQRVAVVRALAHNPALLLMDEPTGNLDSENSRSLLELFRSINHQRGQTLVMITHSADAASAADRVVHMKDGRIVDH
ncbi:MAG: ABC transporter ATP-binding protein, partial [Planctomycetota bacterium]